MTDPDIPADAPSAASPYGAPNVPQPGAPLPPPNVPQYPVQYPSPYSIQYPQQYGAQKPSTILSLLSMIFGIAGIVLVCCGFGFLLGLAAIILGHLGLRKEPARGMALTGLITGYIGAGISVAILLFWVLATIIPALTFNGS